MTILGLTPEQLMNLILTVIIAVAVIAQAWFTRTQARLLKESQRLARDRDKPKVRITPLTHFEDRIGRSGDLETRSSEGFAVTNAGFTDIEITTFALEIGRMLDSGEDGYPTAEIQFAPVRPSTMSLPHRLRPGESFRTLFDRAQLVQESTKIGGETPVHMRPYCYDSLGNKHKTDHWTIYQEENRTTYVDGPSPGRISEEELNQLKPTERSRASRWSQRSIGP